MRSVVYRDSLYLVPDTNDLNAMEIMNLGWDIMNPCILLRLYFTVGIISNTGLARLVPGNPSLVWQ